jgi:hypothetical protein
VSAPGDYDNGEIGGMIGRGNRSTRRKPAPVPLCPLQTLHAARTRTQAAAVGSQRLTAELRHGRHRGWRAGSSYCERLSEGLYSPALFCILCLRVWIACDTLLFLLVCILFCASTGSVRSRNSAVGIATGYRLGDRDVGVRVPVGSRIFTSSCRPDRLWGPPNLLYNGYWGLFHGGKAAGAWSWPLTSI